jgi:autotransporter-associated beta strand protein
MKRIKSNFRPLSLGGIIAIIACFSAGASTLLKLDVTNVLTDPLSWTGSVVPGSADIAQFNGTYASTNTWPLGAATNWNGIQILSPSSALTVQNDGNTLTLGTAGVDMSAASANFTMSNSIVLGASQPWNVASGQTLTAAGVVSDAGNGYGLTLPGAGTVALSAANTFGGGVNLNAGTLNINNASALGTGTLTINGGAVYGQNVTITNPSAWNGDFAFAAGNAYLTFGNNITLSAARTITKNNVSTFTVNGSITGPGSLNPFDITWAGAGGGSMIIRSAVPLRSPGQTNTVGTGTVSQYGPITESVAGSAVGKAGAGTLSLYGTNTYTGPTYVNAGTLSVQTNASIAAGSTVVVNTGGNFTVNAGGLVNGQVYVKTNSVGSSINCTVNGTIAGNVTLDPGTLNGVPTNQLPTAQVGTSAACGYGNVNGGGSLASGGYITNNGVVKFSGSDAPVTFGTFIMPNGLGGIWDANRTPKTFTFPNNSSLAYFKCDSNEVSTLQIAGNGSASIKWLGYNDANTATAQLWTYTNTFDGGTWTIGNIGQNSSFSHYVGNATLTGGANMTITNGVNYSHGTWNIINGSLTFNAQLAEGHAAGNAGLNISVNNTGGGSGILTITNGGFNLGLAANSAPENNSLNIGTGGTASIKGTFQVGTTTAQANAETNAVNLSGGKLVVNGAIQSVAVAGAQDRVFNWTGGQLTATTITTGAGFNDAASSISSSTVSNTAGILAPGDIGTAGKTTITGGYVQTAGGTLAVDIGGTTQANTFTNLGSYYDFVSVSGSATVAGLITANLINGYTPSATTAFTVLTGTGGLVANAGTLGYNGLIPVYTNGVLYGGKYMQVLVAGNNLILTNYGVSVAALAAKFSPTNAVGVAPATPTFTDNSTGVITNRHWNFGDGNTLDTTSTSVSHTYSVVGTYTVTLTVYGIDGSTSTATGTVKATLSADNALWKGGLSGNVWDLTTANWFTNGVTGPYHDPDFVTFDDSGNAASPVNLTVLAQPSSVTFSNVSKNYTVSGSGFISGNTGVSLNGDGVSSGGAVTLLTTNNYTGATVINFGTLQVGNGVADGGIDTSVAITNNGALVFDQNATHNLVATLAGTGTLTKSGTGTLILSGDNSATFSGPVTVNGGTLAVSSDATLGTSGGTVNLTNATLQINSAGTLNRNLNLGGTNISLNVNGTDVLQNVISGIAPVTVGGAGTLQIDTGGSSVSLPTNVVLNGGSISYDRNDNYSQPGTISGSSASSAIDNVGASAGSTNTLTFANGNNLFASIVTETSTYMVLNASPNSTNTIGGADLSGGGAFGPRGANAQFIVAGGTYLVTNSALFGTVGGGFQNSDTFIVNGGTVIASWYGANNAATDGGLHFFRDNLEIDSGTLWTKVWGAAVAPGFAATFNMNGGTFRLDDSGTLPGATAATTFFGLGLGNHSFANVADRYSGDVTATQTGGAIILAASTNNNVELGCANNSGTNHTATYSISGGSLTAIGGVNGGNVKIGGSTDGASTAQLTLTNSGKIVVSGAIEGYSGAAGSQAFTFNGGTLVAGGVNMSSLGNFLGDSTGTLTNNGGTLSPGDAGVAGKTTITGNYTANAGSTLSIDLNGATAATAFTNSGAYYDTVAVSGATSLGGNLVVRTNGFTPTATSAFTILTAGSVSGTFANLTGGRVTVSGSTNTFAVLVTASSVVLTNFSGAASSTPPPASITTSYNGSALVLSWPNGQGWVLEAQTNNITTGLSTNWVRQTGVNSPLTNTVNQAKGTVFYRLVYP